MRSAPCDRTERYRWRSPVADLDGIRVRERSPNRRPAPRSTRAPRGRGGSLPSTAASTVLPCSQKLTRPAPRAHTGRSSRSSRPVDEDAVPDARQRDRHHRGARGVVDPTDVVTGPRLLDAGAGSRQRPPLGGTLDMCRRRSAVHRRRRRQHPSRVSRTSAPGSRSAYRATLPVRRGPIDRRSVRPRAGLIPFGGRSSRVMALHRASPVVLLRVSSNAADLARPRQFGISAGRRPPGGIGGPALSACGRYRQPVGVKALPS